MSESSPVPESPSRLGEGEEATDSVEDQHGGTIAEPDAPESDHPEPDDEQEENAETSLDQPST